MCPAVDLAELRPLAAGVQRREDQGVVVTTCGYDVRIDGDVELVSTLLSACDGRRSVSQIVAVVAPDASEEAHGLMAALVDAGALVDCTEAYRVFHWQSSTESGFFRPIPDGEAIALAGEVFRPPHAPEPALPLQPLPTSLASLVARRRSAVPAAESDRVSFEQLSTILEAMYGAPPQGARPVPSGGGLYPLAVHLLVRTATGPLTRGVWWYDPQDAGLRLVRKGPVELERVLIADPLSDGLLAHQNPALFISAELERPARKYANRGYRLALMEVGAAMQNAYLAGAELDVGVRAIAGFFDAGARDALDLPATAMPLLALLLGS